MKYFSIKNYDRYQHYRDRRPPWIKLHVSLLDDYGFISLSDASKSHLMLLWLLASQTDNKIPHDIPWIKQRIGARGRVNLAELFNAGFLEPWDEQAARGKLEDWSSRYVSAATKASVLALGQHKCCECGATEPLEIDHIVPISKGGTSDPSNLQVLCRPCNRRKRARTEGGESAPQKRSPALRSQKDSALLETEVEVEAEEEVETETTPSPAREESPKQEPQEKQKRAEIALPPEVLDFCQRQQNPAAWLASLLAMQKGVGAPGGKAVTAEHLTQACLEIAQLGGEITPRRFRRVVEQVTEPRYKPNGKGEDAEFVKAANRLQEIASYRDPVRSQSLTAEGWQTITPQERHAIKLIGTIERVLTAKPDQWPFVVRDFLKAQRGATA